MKNIKKYFEYQNAPIFALALILIFALFYTNTRGRIAILEIVYFLPLRPVFGHFFKQPLVIEGADDILFALSK